MVDCSRRARSPADKQLGDAAFYTWTDAETQFSPGRLDWLVYSHTTAQAINAFALDTAGLNDEVLEQAGLDRAEQQRQRSPPNYGRFMAQAAGVDLSEVSAMELNRSPPCLETVRLPNGKSAPTLTAVIGPFRLLPCRHSPARHREILLVVSAVGRTDRCSMLRWARCTSQP